MLKLKPTPVTKTATSHEGYIFEPESRIWKISREYAIHLGWVDELLEKEIVESFLKVLAHYAEKYSASHTNNQCMRFLHFAKERVQNNGQTLAIVSSEALISYRSTLDVDAINEAVARQLAPLAQAFAGMVVAKESEANRRDDLTSRVRCESGNVGTCGLHGFCGALAPIACYTCRNFQPWIDGPHKEVLNSLLGERERILKITKDKTMASINDRTILTVTQVIQICEKRCATLAQERCYD